MLPGEFRLIYIQICSQGEVQLQLRKCGLGIRTSLQIEHYGKARGGGEWL